MIKNANQVSISECIQVADQARSALREAHTMSFQIDMDYSDGQLQMYIYPTSNGNLDQKEKMQEKLKNIDLVDSVRVVPLPEEDRDDGFYVLNLNIRYDNYERHKSDMITKFQKVAGFDPEEGRDFDEGF
jgi:hypothetical protein